MRVAGFCIGMLAVAVALALLTSSAGGAGSRTPKNVLVVGHVISDAVSLDPAEAIEFSTIWVNAQVYDQLVDFDREYSRAVPELAESWKVSPDGRTYMFKLRKGVRFHSGNTVDSRAVEYSLRRVLKLKLIASYVVTPFIARPEDVVATGNDSVRITFSRPMPEVLMASVLSFPISSVVDPALVQRNATSNDPQANKWLSNHDAGSGPFRLIGWTRNVKIEMAAFDSYWRGRPKLNRIIIQEMPEPAAQMLALRQRDIDVAGKLLPGHYRELVRSRDIVVKDIPAWRIWYVGMNTGFGPFSKKEVRNAVRWAIDYDAIKTVYEGGADITQTIVPPGMFGHLAERRYQKNVERARALMRAGGYEPGFNVELLAGSEAPLPDVAAKIKEDLSQIGMIVDLKVLRYSDLLSTYRPGKHQMVIADWGADYPDPDVFARTFADHDEKLLARRNKWDHPVKQLVKQGLVELDRTKRAALYKQIQRIVLDEGPYAVFVNTRRQYAMYTNVRGLEPSPMYETYPLFDVFKE